MPFVTSAVTDAAEPLSYPFRTRDEALLKAIELSDGGVQNVSVADLDSGEVLTGPELLGVLRSIAAEGF